MMTEAAWGEWLSCLPPEAQASLAPYPCTRCYRHEGRGHYAIESYDRNRNTGALAVVLVHGRDSFDPGVAVFGCDVQALSVCGCGNWQPPTDEQKAAKRAELVQAAAERNATR